jgi:hypothetical protein
MQKILTLLVSGNKNGKLSSDGYNQGKDAAIEMRWIPRTHTYSPEPVTRVYSLSKSPSY